MGFERLLGEDPVEVVHHFVMLDKYHLLEYNLVFRRRPFVDDFIGRRAARKLFLFLLEQFSAGICVQDLGDPFIGVFLEIVRIRFRIDLQRQTVLQAVFLRSHEIVNGLIFPAVRQIDFEMVICQGHL